jgi:antitoxin component YwqK of YwqJK toxin-antitoxin module
MNKLIVLLLLPLVSFAQKDTIPKYLDKDLGFTTIDKAVYFGVAIRESNHWLLYALYPDSTPVITAAYRDKQMRIRDGQFIIYYPKYKKAQETFYKNNLINGNWITWYENGIMKDSGRIVNDRMVGLWKSWYSNSQLKIITVNKEMYSEEDERNFQLKSFASNDHYGIKDGEFSSWYINGNQESTGHFKNDVMDGEWRWYFENGNPSTIEVYQHRKIIALKCYDSTGKDSTDFCSISKPATLKVYGDYKQYIMENLIWPELALKKKIEGVVHVHLEISKNGEIKNLKLDSDKKVLQDAVADLFGKMGAWDPAVSHNRVIEWQDDFDIPFYINNNDENNNDE